MPRRAGSGGQRGAPAGCGYELRNSDSLSAIAIRGETEILFTLAGWASGSAPQAISPRPSVCWQYPPETDIGVVGRDADFLFCHPPGLPCARSVRKFALGSGFRVSVACHDPR